MDSPGTPGIQSFKTKNTLLKEESATSPLLCMLSCFSHVQLFSTLLTVGLMASLPMGFTKREYWNGLPCPAPGDLPNTRIGPESPVLQVDSLALSHQGSPTSSMLDTTFSISEECLFSIHSIFSSRFFFRNRGPKHN